jgi:hypothetical protein
MAALENVLANVTRSGSDITFSGVNVHVVNGTGTTTGPPNGVGNLIVGYNEEPGGRPVDRNGSHNIVVGPNNNYSSFGGLVAGAYNTISGASASVSGGYGNTASGFCSIVSGGNSNTASGTDASVSGGYRNQASGPISSVSGGVGNTASGYYASISGGEENTSIGNSSSVSGGRYNKASGDWSFVGGGGHSNPVYGNEAFSHYSAVLGGSYNIAGDNSNPEDHSVGELATISGGDTNRAKGGWSSISGGQNRSVTGAHDWRAGGLFEDY